MANAQRGEVTLTHGGVDYTLRYDVNAICNLEDALDKPIGEIVASMGEDNVSMRLVRAVFQAGLSPAVTLETAGQIMSEIGTSQISEKVGRAFSLAFPESDADEGKPKAAA